MKEAEEADEEPKLEENSAASLENPETVEAVPESSDEAVPESSDEAQEAGQATDQEKTG